MPNKLTYEFIKNSFEKEGYILLSKEYKNCYTHLKYICQNGHQHKIIWSNFKQGKKCKICSLIDRKLNYNSVKQSFEKEGYSLVSKKYTKAHEYLDFICPNGHQHKITWANWYSGKRCGRCYGNIEVTYEQVRESFEKERYKLLSKEYKNNHTYLYFICPNGHQHKMTWQDFKSGRRCGQCFKTHSKPEKEILEYIKKNFSGVIIPNDRTLIKNPKTGQYLELDIYLPKLNKAIEYNGTYFHSNKYQQWKDKIKQQWCKENNIDLLIINEEEWLKNKDWNIINSYITNDGMK